MKTAFAFKQAYVLLLIAVIGLLVALRYLQSGPVTQLVSAHVINMDSSVERLGEFMTTARTARLDVVRWPAFNGRSICEADLTPMKLSKYIYKYGQEHNQPGLLGCYVSHRSLLTHLAAQQARSSDAHLILEDDAYVPPDFWTQWNDVAADLPDDWDIVQLGVTFPNLQPTGAGRLHRHLNDKGNVGTFAYVVRHGSLPKICKYVEYMSDPMDVMFRNKWRTWKMYVVWPEICPHNDHGESVIVDKK